MRGYKPPLRDGFTKHSQRICPFMGCSGSGYPPRTSTDAITVMKKGGNQDVFVFFTAICLNGRRFVEKEKRKQVVSVTCVLESLARPPSCIHDGLNLLANRSFGIAPQRPTSILFFYEKQIQVSMISL